MSSMEKAFSLSPLLPPEVLFSLLRWLTPSDLLTLALACKKLKVLLFPSNLPLSPEVNGVYRSLLLHGLKVPPTSPMAQLRTEVDWFATLQSLAYCRWEWKETAAVSTTDGSIYLTSGMGLESHLLGDLWRLKFDRTGLQVQSEDLTPRVMEGDGPKPRFASSLCCLRANLGHGEVDVLMLFGGSNPGDDFLNDVWLLEVPCHEGGELTWLSPGTLEPSPAMRWGHTVVTYAGRAFVFGGSCPGEAFNDCWMFTIDEEGVCSWRLLQQQQGEDGQPRRPCPRGGHSAIVLGGHYMYVFGGNTLENSFDDLWRLDLEVALKTGLEEWQEITTLGEVPSARIGHVACALGDSMIIHGGRNFLTSKFYDNAYIFNSRKNSWRRLETTNDHPPERTGHAVLPHPLGLAILGGLAKDTSPLGDLRVLKLLTLSQKKGHPTPCDADAGGANSTTQLKPSCPRNPSSDPRSRKGEWKKGESDGQG